MLLSLSVFLTRAPSPSNPPRVENLRDSIASLRDSFQAAVSDMQEQEHQEHRTRSKSAAKLAATSAVQKQDMKAKVTNVANAAAQNGQKSLEASEKKVRVRGGRQA